MKRKLYGFLFLLALVSTVLISCNKDVEDDYRDPYEGIYACTVTGVLTIHTDPIIKENISEQVTFYVAKYGNSMLFLSYEGEGDYEGDVVLYVDQDGYLYGTISGTIPYADTETGAELEMDIKITYDGRIVNGQLILTEVYSGSATISEVDALKIEVPVSGTVISQGNKN